MRDDAASEARSRVQSHELLLLRPDRHHRPCVCAADRGVRHGVGGAALRLALAVRLRPLFPRVPLESLSDVDIDATWSTIADTWQAGYDEQDDHNRR